MGLVDFLGAAKKWVEEESVKTEKKFDQKLRSMSTAELKYHKKNMESKGIPKQYGYDKVVAELRRRGEL
ncbi:MAG TPA: hypothetical protein DCR08_06495 [Lactobacillus sp.]|uniref:hypothetical protein n=1 Tax=Ligilactobacillus murinus TaxID=1622 RepID=UPI00096F34B0|nr:hypothetical protein [Ligilactobacillus murinus]MDE7056509.1 hypothetical protein [Lactobacillus sp.]HAP23601.1 hypothetical protein [Lactobacillus sp.]